MNFIMQIRCLLLIKVNYVNKFTVNYILLCVIAKRKIYIHTNNTNRYRLDCCLSSVKINRLAIKVKRLSFNHEILKIMCFRLQKKQEDCCNKVSNLLVICTKTQALCFNLSLILFIYQQVSEVFECICKSLCLLYFSDLYNVQAIE